ncbi:MAG: PaaI family thioesterase [Thermaurantimonas sp.]
MTHPSPLDIVRYMMSRDAFSRWLGIAVDEVRPGYCKLSMAVRAEMTNGFGIAHGGIAYSLADSALAFAANASGQMAKTVHLSCSYIRALHAGDLIYAEATESDRSKRFSYMDITITSGIDKIASLHGMAFLSDKIWIIPPTSSGAQ